MPRCRVACDARRLAAATFAQGAPASVTGAVIGGSGGSIEPLTFSLKRRRPHVSLTASNACVSFEGKTSEDYTAAAGACRYGASGEAPSQRR